MISDGRRASFQFRIEEVSDKDTGLSFPTLATTYKREALLANALDL